MNLRHEPPITELEGLYHELSGEYDLSETPYCIGRKAFSFLSVLDSYALLDRISPEEFVRDEQMPYWAEIWPAAIILSGFIADELSVTGKRVVEIGAGVGMVSVTAAACGAAVFATDYSIEALRFIRYNALMNKVPVETGRLDWRAVQCAERFDMLFAADVLYERVNLLPIVTAIDKLLKPGGAAYIADPRRRLAGQFLELAGENGYAITTYSKSYTDGKLPVGVNIYRLSKKNDG